jgi:predicted membrane channel-forming protein YqfA (hemolysin III family)
MNFMKETVEVSDGNQVRKAHRFWRVLETALIFVFIAVLISHIVFNIMSSQDFKLYLSITLFLRILVLIFLIIRIEKLRDKYLVSLIMWLSAAVFVLIF